MLDPGQTLRVWSEEQTFARQAGVNNGAEGFHWILEPDQQCPDKKGSRPADSRSHSQSSASRGLFTYKHPIIFVGVHYLETTPKKTLEAEEHVQRVTVDLAGLDVYVSALGNGWINKSDTHETARSQLSKLCF